MYFLALCEYLKISISLFLQAIIKKIKILKNEVGITIKSKETRVTK